MSAPEPGAVERLALLRAARRVLAQLAAEDRPRGLVLPSRASLDELLAAIRASLDDHGPPV